MSSTGNFEHLPLANGDLVPIRFRVDGRARRISIKIEKIGGLVTVTAPTESALPAARRFLSKRVGWLAARRSETEPATPFNAGERVPYLGRLRRLVAAPKAIDPVTTTDDALIFAGPPETIERNLIRFYKADALNRLKSAAARHAKEIDAEITGITVRDPKTRWGSCAATGRLSFSWRLVMAPLSVLDYVAAHEVAHLRHMNHGDAFWKLVAELDPEYSTAEDWLKNEGPGLRRYG